jgi:hypothetical protein
MAYRLQIQRRASSLIFDKHVKNPFSEISELAALDQPMELIMVSLFHHFHPIFICVALLSCSCLDVLHFRSGSFAHTLHLVPHFRPRLFIGVLHFALDFVPDFPFALVRILSFLPYFSSISVRNRC